MLIPCCVGGGEMMIRSSFNQVINHGIERGLRGLPVTITMTNPYITSSIAIVNEGNFIRQMVHVKELSSVKSEEMSRN